MSSPQSSNDAPSSLQEQAIISSDFDALKSAIESKRSIVESQITCLHGTFDSKLDALKQKADSTLEPNCDLNEKLETMDSKLQALNQRVSNVENSVKSLEKSFTDFARMQNIVFAIDHSHVGSFLYHDCSDFICSSKDLMIDILLNFRQGKGFEVPSRTIDDRNLGYLNESANICKEGMPVFRSKLVEQIELLTGTKPKLEFDPNRKTHFIYMGN